MNLDELKKAAAMVGFTPEAFIKRKVELKHQHIALLADEIVRIRGEVDELMGMMVNYPLGNGDISAQSK